jgi:hypothetical protein
MQSAARAELAASVRASKERPCPDCGLEYDPEIMCFHHIDPTTKEGEVSQVINTWPWERVLAEMEKCVVLCANCHAARHIKEKKRAYDRNYNKVRKGLSGHSPRKAAKASRHLREEGRKVKFPTDWRYLTGTLYQMPIERSEEDLIRDANRAAQQALATRKRHSRHSKPGQRQRETDIRLALERIERAMTPLRRVIARLPYVDDPSDGEGLREASQALQRERRKLWKMKQHKSPEKEAPPAPPTPVPHAELYELVRARHERELAESRPLS